MSAVNPFEKTTTGQWVCYDKGGRTRSEYKTQKECK